jgi:hypothetical protein
MKGPWVLMDVKASAPYPTLFMTRERRRADGGGVMDIGWELTFCLMIITSLSYIMGGGFSEYESHTTPGCLCKISSIPFSNEVVPTVDQHLFKPNDITLTISSKAIFSLEGGDVVVYYNIPLYLPEISYYLADRLSRPCYVNVMLILNRVNKLSQTSYPPGCQLYK